LATNPYFKFQDRNSEQRLLEDLNIEAIQIHGMDIVYLPRENQKEDLIFGEDTLSKFTKGYEVEIYIKTFDGHTGEGDILTKFGLEIRDRATLTISKSRFLEELDGSGLIRPREGDLIYMPLKERPVLYEIMFVEQESPFHQLGDLYVYDLQVEQFKYSHERFTTGYEEIDSVEDLYKNPVILQLGTGAGIYLVGESVYQGASLATATASGMVVNFNQSTKVLTIKNIVGKFQTADGNVQGEDSSASWTLTSSDSQNITTDVLADNKRLQNESVPIIDFSEKDPFSEGKY
jgi:hypothetical protein